MAFFDKDKIKHKALSIFATVSPLVANTDNDSHDNLKKGLYKIFFRVRIIFLLY